MPEATIEAKLDACANYCILEADRHQTDDSSRGDLYEQARELLAQANGSQKTDVYEKVSGMITQQMPERIKQGYRLLGRVEELAPEDPERFQREAELAEYLKGLEKALPYLETILGSRNDVVFAHEELTEMFEELSYLRSGQ